MSLCQPVREFLREWINWADAGAGWHDVFNRETGLCDQYDGWLDTTGYDWEVYGRELPRLFVQDGLNRTYPFGERAYYEDYANSTHHLNTMRLGWVRRKLAEDAADA